MVHKETKEWAPISRFLNAPQLVKDVTRDHRRRAQQEVLGVHDGAGDAEELQPFQAPPSLQ